MARMIGHEYRTTVVYVDSYNGNVLKGSLRNPFLTNGDLPFSSTMEFLQLMDNMLDDMQFPQTFEQRRSFSSTAFSNPAPQPDAENKSGKLATFALRVFYRQNSSWQGVIDWAEKRQSESFRSVLELLMLMNSALTAAER